jgi:putative phosphoesterase
MRIGLISDIHGNLSALETVLGAIDLENVDQLICLGDLAALGPRPDESISRIRSLGCPTVIGNTDCWLVPDPPVALPAPKNPGQAEIASWCAGQLSAESAAFIRNLPTEIEIDLGGLKLLCVHASPRSVDEVITATTPPDELGKMLDGRSFDIMAGGHTHVQLVRRHEQSHIVNPGSIGLSGIGPSEDPNLPRNERVYWSEFAILTARNGNLSIELRRIPLNLTALIDDARASGMPAVDWWIKRWA